MNAEEYSTKNAKDPEDVFKLYHAFKAGEKKGSTDLLWGPVISFMVIGFMIGCCLVKYKLIN